jgi:glycosyltransferase involved in cell wall biosynthesis
MKLKNSKIILATHVRSTGSITPTDELLKYLLKNDVSKVVLITHPIVFTPNINGSGYELYLNGNSIKSDSKFFKIVYLPSFVMYLNDLILTLIFAIKLGHHYDLYIGYDNLNALSGLILRKLGIVKKCVFYVIDFTPKRFENRFLNWVYHSIESFCAVNCDETWNLSCKMIKAREHFKNISPKLGNQRVVPMGIWFEELRRFDSNEIDNTQLVFMGYISKKQGIQYVLKAIPNIVAQISDFKFLVIGDGEYLQTLKDLASNLQIDDHVKFAGYIEDQNDMHSMISRSSFAVALYEEGDPERNYTYYADPGKLKEYLGLGVPILLTDVPHNAQEIVKKGCGKIIIASPEEISKIVVELMSNEENIIQYRKNAINYANEFDWNAIYTSNVGRIISGIKND